MTSPRRGPSYKILLQSQWQSWLSQPRTQLPGTKQTAHLFTGAGIDIQDGFIHLSSAAQCIDTYEKWFAPQNPTENPSGGGSGENLVLIEIDLGKVVGKVEWEVAAGRGDVFAHIYEGGIPYVPRGEDGDGASAVIKVWERDEVKRDLFEEIARNG